MKKTMFFLLAAVCAFGVSLFGQVTTGTVSGRVVDASGGVLPGVSVAIRNTETDSGRTALTDEKGYYRAPNLSLGQYEITASLDGFQTQVRRGITLNLGQNAVVEFTLQVGAVAERVEVTAEAPLIETTNANVAGLVSERQVMDLPLNARNLIELAPLSAGVAYSASGDRSASKGMATKLTISGTRYNSSLFQLDGVGINSSGGSAGSATGILMGAETIREFNVITNGYSAEFGSHSGGVFNAVTKSGTNTVHGSAFEFLRNDKLDARNFFDRDTKYPSEFTEPPPYKRNQFGASLGGPILRDRSFFFGSYEGLRERLGNTQTFNVPGPDIRQGRVPNPTTGVITDVGVAAAIKPYLESYPLPTGTVRSDGTADYIATRSLPTGEDFFTIRGDHKISDSDSMFARYTRDTATNTPGTMLMAYTLNKSVSHYAALGETRIFSPTVINQFLAGFSRTSDSQINSKVEGFVFPMDNFTGRPNASLGVINIPLLSSWGGSGVFPRDYLNNTFQVKNDVFYTRSAHSLKFGFNVQRFQFNHFETSNPGGTWAFNNITDFLRGTVNSFTALTAASEATSYVRQTIYGFYAQDDFRVSPRLSLNMGFRYEFTTVPVDRFDRVSNLRDFRVPGQSLADLQLGNPFFLNPSLKNFAPRIGLAWDPTGNGKTSIRAGAGIFHEQLNAGPFLFGMQGSPPYFLVGQILTAGVARFPDAFQTQQQLMLGQVFLEGFQYEADQPAVYKYSADVQHEVFANTSINAGFSATRGVHLMRLVNMNPRVAQERDGRLFVSSTAPFFHPNLGRVRPRFTDDTSSYYAFRLTATRRFSRGLQFQGAYTWSKTLDDGSNFTGGSDFSNSPGQARYFDLKEKALAAFDLRHTLVSNFTYDIPSRDFSGVGGKLLSGWQLSGIVSLQTGNPNNVSTGFPPAFIRSGFILDYPDLVGEIKYNPRDPNRYFDASAFQLPPGYSDPTILGGAFIGNTGRSILTDPGIAKFDLVLTKETRIRESVELQFRSEFFNLLNRANFGSSVGTLYSNAAGAPSPTQGRITTAAPARQIQFGLRLAF